MTHFPHRRLGVPVLASLIAVAGCSSGDGDASVAVPRPSASVVKICEALDKALPAKVDDLSRRDPEPASALTAGWGDPAIILRCGVVKPAAMDDADADGVEVNGVGWLLEKRDGGVFRLTTTLRKAYVEVSIPAQRTGHGLAPLVDLAGAISKSVPEGIAD